MSFLSIQFALFLGISVPAYYLCPARTRPLFLLAASYVFYFLWSPLASLGIFVATGFAYVLGLALDKHHEADPKPRGLIVFGVSTLVAYLAVFKLMGPLRGFVAETKDAPHGLVVFLAENAALPLGISYYTFKLLSYLIDIYWGNLRAEKRFVHFAAYVAFFPQIVAGPIQRSGDFLEQIEKLEPTPDKMRRGLRRLLLGCFKKAVVADNLAGLIGASYPHHQVAEYSTVLAFYLFPLQMLADFSGLTDIAIGTGLLFGIESPENFDHPFAATSISQYWRRWHMSLTSWLTDYLFMPLRMATRGAGKWGLAFSLMVNMVIIGIWHQVAWTFVVFGLLHGAFLVVDTLTSRARANFFSEHPGWDRAANLVGPVFTYHLVALAMVFVLAESVAQGWGVLTHLFARPAYHFGITEPEPKFGLVALAAWCAYEIAAYRGVPKLEKPLPVFVRWAVYYSVIWAIVEIWPQCRKLHLLQILRRSTASA